MTGHCYLRKPKCYFKNIIEPLPIVFSCWLDGHFIACLPFVGKFCHESTLNHLKFNLQVLLKRLQQCPNLKTKILLLFSFHENEVPRLWRITFLTSSSNHDFMILLTFKSNLWLRLVQLLLLNNYYNSFFHDLRFWRGSLLSIVRKAQR